MDAIADELALRLEIAIKRKAKGEVFDQLFAINANTSSNTIEFIEPNQQQNSIFTFKRILPARTLGWYGWSDPSISEFEPTGDAVDIEAAKNEVSELHRDFKTFMKEVERFNRAKLETPQVWIRYLDANELFRKKLQEALKSSIPAVVTLSRQMTERLLTSLRDDVSPAEGLGAHYTDEIRKRWESYQADYSKLKTALGV
jgi:hypothetical protein